MLSQPEDIEEIRNREDIVSSLEFLSYSKIRLGRYASKKAYSHDFSIFQLLSKLYLFEIKKDTFQEEMIGGRFPEIEKKEKIQEKIEKIRKIQDDLLELHNQSIFLLCEAFVSLDIAFDDSQFPGLLKIAKNLYDFTIAYNDTMQPSNEVVSDSCIAKLYRSKKILINFGFFVIDLNNEFENKQISEFFQKEKTEQQANFIRSQIKDQVTMIDLNLKHLNQPAVESYNRFLKIDLVNPITALQEIRENITNIIESMSKMFYDIESNIMYFPFYSHIFFSRIKTEGAKISDTPKIPGKTNSTIHKIDYSTFFIKQGDNLNKLPLEPILSLIKIFKLYSFKIRMQHGRLLYSHQVFPQQTIKLRKTNFDKIVRQGKSLNSIFDSESPACYKSIRKHLGSSELKPSRFLDKIEHYIKIKEGSPTKLSVNCDEFDLEKLPDFENPKIRNHNNCQESNRIISELILQHSLETRQNRDISIFLSPEKISPEVEANTIPIISYNPLHKKIANFNYYLVDEIYFCAIVLSDIYIAFTNGETYQELPIGNFQNILDQYVQKEKHGMIKSAIVSAGITRDFLNREIQLIKTLQNSNSITIDRSNYEELCEKNNLEITEELTSNHSNLLDFELSKNMKRFAAQVFGIPTQCFFTQIPMPYKIDISPSLGASIYFDDNNDNDGESSNNLSDRQ